MSAITLGLLDGVVNVSVIRERAASSNDRALVNLITQIEDNIYAGTTYGFRKSERYRSLSDALDEAVKEAYRRMLDV
jgi:hypothetical protein